MKPHACDLRKGRLSEPNRIYLITTVTRQRIPWFDDLFAVRAVIQALHAPHPPPGHAGESDAG